MSKKKKRGRPKQVDVKTSKPHRRKKFWRKGGWVDTSKPHRNKKHKRNPRRTKEEIKKKGRRMNKK